MKRSLSLLMTLSLFLTACGGNTSPPNPVPPPPSGGGTLSGTVLTPPGGNVAQTGVQACFVEPGQSACNPQSPNTTNVGVSSASGTFAFSSLVAGQYILTAIKDINTNAQLDAGDYLGCYGDASGCLSVAPPQANLNIQMEVAGGTPPDPGTGTGAISGTLVFPGSLGATSLGEDSEGAVTQGAVDQTQFRVRTAPRTSQRRFVPGEVIVKFATDEVQLQSLSVQGLSVQRAQAAGLPRTALYRAPSLDKKGTLALIDALNACPDVVYAEPNYIKSIMKTPNDPLYPLQWHYEAMNLSAAWDISDGTMGNVTVAVVDTGAINHPDLQNVWLGGYDFVSDPTNGADGDAYDADPTDLGGDSVYHGSHVAGTVAASTNDGAGVAGVSWGARVVPVRVLGVTGGGSNLDIVNGVLWAAGESVAGVPANPNPASVINLSLGGEMPCSRLEQEAFNSVRAKGITVVVAAGNENMDASRSAPANCEGVIVVGATGPQGTRAPYSNYGATLDVMAPGGDSSQTLSVGGETIPAGVFSTIGDGAGGYTYAFYDGTSMATPHVAGLVALMLAQEPGLTPDAVLARLQSSAVPLSEAECEQPGNSCGAGLVDAAAALGRAGTPTPPTPPPVTGNAPTLVAAFYCLAECSSFDLGLSGRTDVSINALQVPFRIADLTPGTYIVAAWQDLNNDAEVNDGEPFGRNLNALPLAAGQEIDRADIYLAPFTSQSTASQIATTLEAEAQRQRLSKESPKDGWLEP